MGFLEISRLFHPRSVSHLVSRMSCASSRTHDVLTIFMPKMVRTFWCLLDSGVFDILTLCAQQWERIWKQEHLSESWSHWADVTPPWPAGSDPCGGEGSCAALPQSLSSMLCYFTSVLSWTSQKLCPVGLEHFWKQISSVILLGFILSQSKWVAVLTIVLQMISINVGKWKQKASMFPIINNRHDCLAQSPELEGIYLLLQCWRTFYQKSMHGQRQATVKDNCLQLGHLVVVVCCDSIMNYN